MSESSCFQLSLEADPDPLLPGRLLARLTVANRLPSRFAFHVIGEDTLVIETDIRGVDRAAARRLANQIGAVATVRSVTLRAGDRIVSLDPGD